MKVLIFDSDMLLRSDLKLTFQLHGVATSSTGDQRQALSMLASGPYDLVIAGVSPYADGVSAFVRAVRSASYNLPMFIEAAHEAETMHLKIVSAYVEFPVSPRALQFVLRAATTKVSKHPVALTI
jgi:DNA-binding response OmpR family regulator